MASDRTTAKVGLIGTGMVGSSFAYALMQSGLANELVLIDADARRAEGEAMDLNHGVPFARPIRIRSGRYEDLQDSDVVVIAAGASQKPGQTRLDLLQKNADVVRDIVPQVVACCPESLIVIATNPVDILTCIAAELSGLPDGRVIGSGTILDTARFRHLLGAHYGVEARSVHAHIIGEHGDSAVPVWSLANIAGVRLHDFTGPHGQSFDPKIMNAIFEQTRTAAYEIIQRKQSTYYAIGMALLALVEAILRDQHTVLTVSSPLRGQHGVEGMAVSLPSVVGRKGVEEVIEIPLSPEEADGFRRSARTLTDRLAQIT